jgi:hypothetical protein
VPAHPALAARRECDKQKLLHLFYKGAVAEEVLAAEQDRIDGKRSEARRWADVAAMTRARSCRRSRRR